MYLAASLLLHGGVGGEEDMAEPLLPVGLLPVLLELLPQVPHHGVDLVVHEQLGHLHRRQGQRLVDEDLEPEVRNCALQAQVDSVLVPALVSLQQLVVLEFEDNL